MRSGLPFAVKFLLAFALCVDAQAVEYGMRDPEFDRVPFAEWAAGAPQERLRWSLEVVPPELSTHQRMLLRIAVRVDGREFEKRQGDGEFVAFFQYQDATGHVWQNHASVDLQALQPGMDSREVRIAHYAFALPGDYSIVIALWHSGSGSHAVHRRKIHVPSVANDPLPAAWTGVPPVEFIENITDPPDVWYLPDTIGKLHLPVGNTRPVHVDIVVNTTPSERSAGSVSALRRNMSLLIPALKALTAISLQAGTIDVSLLDLTHRRTTFSQKDVHSLDWKRMRQVFVETNPGVVDVATLQNQWRMRRFFADEVSRRLEDKHVGPHVVIILSGPAFLIDQEAVESEPLPADPDHKLLYIRYRGNPARMYGPRRPRPGARPMPPPPAFSPLAVDDLERTVQPMNARLYDATSPEQFRRVLASVIDQIAKF